MSVVAPFSEEQRRLPVLLHVEECEMLGEPERRGLHDVYCLATEHGTAVFNGFLMSQCDALRYMVFTSDASYGATIGTAAQKEVSGSGDVFPTHGGVTDRFAHRGNRKDGWSRR